MEKQSAIRFYTMRDMLDLTSSGQLQPEGVYVNSQVAVDEASPFDYPFRSNHFSVLLVQEGELHCKVDLMDHVIRKNNLLFVVPNAVKQFTKVHTGTRFIAMIFTMDFLVQAVVNKKHLDSLDFMSSQNNPRLEMEQEEADLLASHMLQIREKGANRPDHPFHTEILKYSFLQWLYETAAVYMRANALKTIQMTRKENLVMRFMKLVLDHCREERSVQYYAGKLYLSPKYLTETVKEVTGKTAGELIDDSVIMEAKILLTNVEVPVAEVARALYFSDQFFFSKYFKKHTGLTPTEYRKDS